MMWGKDREEDKLNSDVLKREVKSLGFSSPSCKHTWSFSDRPLLSGIMVYSAIWRQIKVLWVLETLNILTGAPAYLWFFSINLIHLNVVSHQPLQDNVLKKARYERILPIFIILKLYHSMHCSSMVLMCSAFFTHHDFTVFLFVYVLITEDVAGTHHSQFASFLQDIRHLLAYLYHKYYITYDWVWNSVHRTFPWWKAKTGLLKGKHSEPVERTATAGFITLNVAPYGYKKVRALNKGNI